MFVRSLAILFLLTLGSNLSKAQKDENLVTIDDLDLIIGDWHGSLTYLDYSSGKPYSMPVEATISAGKKTNALDISIVYPNEPKANNDGKITISKDGKSINKQTVVSRIMNASGEVEIRTEDIGKDDNRKATIRYTYIFGKKRFINRKEVRFSEEENWILRNEYNYRRRDL